MQLDLFNTNLSGHNSTEVSCKVCNTCNTLKPLSQYGRAAGGNHVRPDCKQCSNHAQSVREKLKKDIPYPDDSYCCPICDKSADELRYKTQPNRKVWCLDHNHKTDAFRGYVCFRCNIAVGQVKDDPTIAYRLFEYLKGSP